MPRRVWDNPIEDRRPARSNNGAVDWVENALLTIFGLAIAVVVVGAIRVFG